MAERILEKVSHRNLPATIPPFIKVIENRQYIIMDINELDPVKINSKVTELIMKLYRTSTGTGFYFHSPVHIQFKSIERCEPFITIQNLGKTSDEPAFKREMYILARQLSKLE